MKGIVWGATMAVAQKELDEIRKEYEFYLKISPVSIAKSYSQYIIHFENGDSWIAVSAREYERGRKCNVSYIDINIDDKFISNIIKPSTVAPPYNAIHYYSPGKE